MVDTIAFTGGGKQDKIKSVTVWKPATDPVCL